jgi:CelD/BcsL family acetyltransferase involved in cellulose biosynthesis
VLIEDKGELVGAAPMCTNHTRVMGLPINTLTMVGNLNPYLGYDLYSVFAKRDDHEAIREMLTCVKKARWNKLFMPYMETNRHTTRFLDGIFQMWEGQSSCLEPEMHHTYVFPLEGNIMADLGKSTRGNIQRLRNKLERTGRMEFRKVRSAEDAVRAMDLYLSQHEERWGDRNSIFRIPSNRKQLVELGKLAVSTEKGEINELLIDGEVAGQVLSFIDGNVARAIRIGMADKFRDFSPGMMVFALTMEENRKNGLREFDPGRGNEEYKLRMTNNHRALCSALAYKGTMGVVSRVRSFAPVKVLEGRLQLEDRIMRLNSAQAGTRLDRDGVRNRMVSTSPPNLEGLPIRIRSHLK